MATSLATLLPPTRSGRTFFVASTLLGLFAFAQFLMLGWFLLRGPRPSAQAQTVLPIIQFAETSQPGVPAADVPVQSVPYRPTPLIVPTPAVSGGTTAGTAPLLNRPTPVPAARANGEGRDLLEQSRQMRQRGDMNAALGKLREALVAEPENPQVIAEMAITYEAMQLPEKAAEQWQRLFNMGESIGAVYYLADSKLHSAPASAGSFDGANLTDAAAGRAGFQSTASMKITDIRLEDLPDPEAEKKLALRIVVKNRPGVVIDPTRVKIEAYFYDLVDGRDVVQTDAQTDYAWLTPAPINWANDKSEVLEAIYLRAKGLPVPTALPEAPRGASRRVPRGGGKQKVGADDATAAAVAAPAPVRTYLGYAVRLYYDRQLQDVQADPVRLLQQFPPPMTLAAE